MEVHAPKLVVGDLHNVKISGLLLYHGEHILYQGAAVSGIAPHERLPEFGLGIPKPVHPRVAAVQYHKAVMRAGTGAVDHVVVLLGLVVPIHPAVCKVEIPGSRHVDVIVLAVLIKPAARLHVAVYVLGCLLHDYEIDP